ncbi:MAG: class II fructose-bisphosphate aldolase [Enterocloster sp.]
MEKTDIDSLAVAIGNQHGAYTAPPQINFEILEKVRRDVSIPLVLHGASGIGDEDIRHAISLGITKINIHTELCEAAMSAIEAQRKGRDIRPLISVSEMRSRSGRRKDSAVWQQWKGGGLV